VVKPGDVSVVILNGTRRAGFAAATGEFLKTQGVNIAEVGNAPNKDTAESLIVHTPGNNLKAQLVAKLLGITNISEDSELQGSDVAVILGNNAPQTWSAPTEEVTVSTPTNEPIATPEPTPSAVSAPTSGLFCPIP